MSQYRFTLEPYNGPSTRYICPGCNDRGKTFVCYTDTEAGGYIDSSVGRCNRESKCGYHYTPKQYFNDNNISFNSPGPKMYLKPKAVVPVQKTVSLIPVDIFKASLKDYEANHFVKFLIGLFGVEVTNELISKYFIGTSNYWEGATVFWQIDCQGKIRTGKIMLYNPATGKRVKEPFNHIAWAHQNVKQPEFELKQCFFGEHLLKDKTKPVAIVESEKSAIIASVYLPQFIWLAAGSLSNLNIQKCIVLKGRTVSLYPDVNGYEKWNSKAIELSFLASINISDLLENKATDVERQQGYDIADYLIKFDYREFTSSKPEISGYTEPELIKQENWDHDIIELEKYFEITLVPPVPVKLNPASTIIDISLFVQSHLSIVKENSGKRTFLQYLNRLKELKHYLTVNQK